MFMACFKGLPSFDILGFILIFLCFKNKLSLCMCISWEVFNDSSTLNPFYCYIYNKTFNEMVQGLANFFCKGLNNKFFSIVGYSVSVLTVQLCQFNLKAARDNM